MSVSPPSLHRTTHLSKSSENLQALPSPQRPRSHSVDTIKSASPILKALSDKPKIDCCTQFLYWITYLITFSLVDLFPKNEASDQKKDKKPDPESSSSSSDQELKEILAGAGEDSIFPPASESDKTAPLATPMPGRVSEMTSIRNPATYRKLFS
jgi:hypothetical protein